MCKTIVIDDNPMEHVILQKMFERYDLFPQNTHSFNGESVISFMEENYDDAELLPDVIFLDLNMPYSGWDFMGHLLPLVPALAKVPQVYIITSSIDANDKQRAAGYDFVKGYLTKPLKKDELSHLYSAFSPISRLAS